MFDRSGAVSLDCGTVALTKFWLATWMKREDVYYKFAWWCLSAEPSFIWFGRGFWWKLLRGFIHKVRLGERPAIIQTYSQHERKQKGVGLCPHFRGLPGFSSGQTVVLFTAVSSYPPTSQSKQQHKTTQLPFHCVVMGFRPLFQSKQSLTVGAAGRLRNQRPLKQKRKSFPHGEQP